jgi:hypothetical protein
MRCSHSSIKPSSLYAIVHIGFPTAGCAASEKASVAAQFYSAPHSNPLLQVPYLPCKLKGTGNKNLTPATATENDKDDAGVPQRAARAAAFTRPPYPTIG